MKHKNFIWSVVYNKKIMPVIFHLCENTQWSDCFEFWRVRLQVMDDVAKVINISNFMSVLSNGSGVIEFWRLQFLPRNAMLARYVLWPCVCLSQVVVVLKRFNGLSLFWHRGFL